MLIWGFHNHEFCKEPHSKRDSLVVCLCALTNQTLGKQGLRKCTKNPPSISNIESYKPKKQKICSQPQSELGLWGVCRCNSHKLNPWNTGIFLYHFAHFKVQICDYFCNIWCPPPRLRWHNFDIFQGKKNINILNHILGRQINYPTIYLQKNP